MPLRLARLVALALATSIVLAGPAASVEAAGAPAAVDALRVTGPAHETALLAADAWQAARKAARPADRADEAVTVRALAFAGAAQLVADEVSRRGAPALASREHAASLETLAASFHDAADLAGSALEVRAALRAARESIVRLRAAIEGQAPAPGTPTAAPPPGTNTTPPPSSTPPPSTSQLEPPKKDPNAPTASFDSVAFKRTLQPDLVVTGRIEGRGLTRGEVQLKSSSAAIAWRDAAVIQAAIGAALAGQPKDGLATVTFRQVIGNDDIPAGDFTVVLVVEDSRGRRGETSTPAPRRGLF